MFSWKPGFTMKSKRLYQKQFRNWQVFLCLLNELYASVALVSQMVMCINVISYIFCIIKLRNRWNIFGLAILFNFLIDTLGMNSILLQFIIECSNNSSGCRRSFEQNDLGRSKYDILFWKSCPRLKIQMGQLFTVESKEFLMKLYGNVLLETCVDLLLTF